MRFRAVKLQVPSVLTLSLFAKGHSDVLEVQSSSLKMQECLKTAEKNRMKSQKHKGNRENKILLSQLLIATSLFSSYWKA